MKDNKLIAEFWGMKLGDDKSVFYDDAENLHPPTLVDELQFHTSWDWLMPVLKKINIQLNPDNYNNWRMINRPTEYYLEDVYAQAVYFIQQLKQEEDERK